MKSFDYLVIDIGSTYTKTRLFDGFKLIGTEQSPTTLNNVGEGIKAGEERIQNVLGTKSLNAKNVLVTSSAAGGLRMVAMGYMVRVTVKAAKEVAMNAGAKVLEVVSHEDPRDYRIQILKEISPDIILLAGGTDFGNQNSIIENARLIVESEVKSVVIVAGNIEAQKKVCEILDTSGVEYKKVPNIMPIIHELRVKEAREAIHHEFIRQIIKARGLKELKNKITNDRIVPTPGAVLLGAELLAKGTYREKGLGGLVVVDVGGATTDVHSIIPDMEALSNEEKGLIVTNEKQVSYRTVEGNLGLRVSAVGILDTVPAKDILEMRNQGADDDLLEKFIDYCRKAEEHTQYVPQSEMEERFDQFLAETAVEVAIKRHAGYISQDYDPVMGIVPGTPIGRDLRKTKTIIGVGGIFSYNSTSKGQEILRDAIKNPGISLLPENPEIIIDENYILYAAGVISMVDEEYAFSILKNYFIR